VIRDEQQPPSRIVERILGSRKERKAVEPDLRPEGTVEYVAYEITEGFPRMAFTLGTYIRDPKEFSVQSHGILFHDVKKPKWRQYDGFEFVNFSHSGEAYTLRGRNLYPLYLALMDCTLQSVLEYDDSVFAPVDQNAPIVDRVAVTDVAEMVRRSREDRDSGTKH